MVFLTAVANNRMGAWSEAASPQDLILYSTIHQYNVCRGLRDGENIGKDRGIFWFYTRDI